MVMVSGTPSATPEPVPKLLVMSLRTMPLSVSTLIRSTRRPGTAAGLLGISVPAAAAVVAAALGVAAALVVAPVADVEGAVRAAGGESGGQAGAAEQAERPAAGQQRRQVVREPEVVLVQLVVVVVVGALGHRGASRAVGGTARRPVLVQAWRTFLGGRCEDDERPPGSSLLAR